MILSRLGENARKRDLVILAISVLLILGAAVAVFSGVHRAEVQFVNGLDVPVNVEVAGEIVPVGPAGRVSRSLAVGIYEVTTRAGETTVETGLIEARRGADAIVYNVLGAAPIIVFPAIYQRSPTSSSDDRKPSLRMGSSFSIDDPVDYVFVEPPSSISSDEHSGDIVKQVMKLVDGGWGTTASFLAGLESSAAAAEVMTRVVSVEYDSVKAVGYATKLRTDAYGHGSAMPMLLDVLGRDPANDYAARSFLFEGCRVIGCEAGQRLLSALPAGPPGDDKGSLVRSLRALQTGSSVGLGAWKKAADDALVASGNDSNVQRWAGSLALRQGDYPACVEHFERVLSDSKAFMDFSEYGRCLVLLGRASDAKAEARRKVDPDLNAFNANGFYVRASLLDPAMSPEDPALFDWMSLSKRTAGDARTKGEIAERTRLRLLAARPLDTDAETALGPLRDAVHVGMAALKSPDAALHECDAAESLDEIPETLRVLLGAEFLRMGRAALGRKLLFDSEDLRLAWNDVVAYVKDGVEAAGFARLDPEERAALDLVRARELDAAGVAGAPLYARAAAQDSLKGWVTRAAKAWDRPRGRGALVGGLAALPASHARR